MGYEPIKVGGERVWRTYIGGGYINCLHGNEKTEDGHFPEEWMYSVTKAMNVGREELTEGLCLVNDGSHVPLKELIENNPEAMLGEDHVKKWGASPGVLIKIIDSMERLTIQVHPDKQMAEQLFHSKFGKTECWHIMKIREELKEPGCIYLGFREGITRKKWIRCFEDQDYEQMLSLLNKIEVKKGETYLVHGGVPHAIGAGCIIMEIQEPTDYTIRAEKVTPSGFIIADRMCHQGLGFDRMFDCFTYEGASEKQIRERVCIREEEIPQSVGKRSQLIGYRDTACFRMEKLEISTSCCFERKGVFSCLYVYAGEGTLRTNSREYNIHKGEQFFVPAQTDNYWIELEVGHTIILLELYGPQ